MATYRQLTEAGVATRAAAALVGVPRASATRRPQPHTPRARRVPVNKLSDAERARILAVVNSDRFVDLPPIQIFAQLLDEGLYLALLTLPWVFWRAVDEGTPLSA